MGKNLVIIGGGNAGPSAAFEAKKLDPDMNITIMESGAHAAAAT